MKIENLDQYISNDTCTVNVLGAIDIKDDKLTGLYIDGKGYIGEDETVWIYSQNKPKNADQYPYFWINKDDKVEYSNPEKSVKDSFNCKNIVDMSLVNIIETTKEHEVLFDEKVLNDINSSSSNYIPIIKDSDDFLKKIVKTIIATKKIDLNRLKSKTTEKYVLPNMRSALDNDTKMSVNYFNIWMELLGCDFYINIADNGTDEIDPLKFPQTYQSTTNKIYNIVNGELIENNVNLLHRPDEIAQTEK